MFSSMKKNWKEQLSQALSRAIAASKISIIVLSADYASSKSCLVELSDIMDRYRNKQQIVLPIFYHVDPSNVRNIGGSFKTSFEKHESKQPTDTVQRWKSAFAEVGKLKGWHIGGKFDRPETDYIKNVVEYVIKKSTNIGFESASEELVGIDYQKNAILKLIKQKDCRVLGLWGMGGQGKTTLAEAVYKKISSEFKSHWFLQNVREEIKKQGKESLRNEFLSKLLNSNVHIGTPSIGSTLTQERLNKKKVLVVLDDVDDLDQIDYMGVKHFGYGSKTIITSRDRQVLESGGADTIHEMKGLNKNDSLQLFSTFAFKQLNPAVGFQDQSRRFVKYTQGNPLALKVLGSDLNKRSINYWESKVEKLKDCPPEKKISEALKSSYDGLDIVEQNIFLDIACFFKGEPIQRTKHILSGCYKGAECGINKLVDKCLINVSSSVKYSIRRNSYSCPYIIYMHDALEEMGKYIVCQESKTLGKCSRLWNLKHVEEVLKYNKGTDRIQGIKLDMSCVDNLLFQPFVFEKMINLRYIFFYCPSSSLWKKSEDYKKLLTYQVDIVSLPDELRYLRWDYYPFKSLSSSFNPKNLVALKLPQGNMEQLWNEGHQDLVHLREIDLFSCKNLKKIPNLLGALILERLDCEKCESLVKLPSLAHLTSLKTLHLMGCHSLKKFPEIPNDFEYLDLSETGIEEVPDLIGHLLRLKWLSLSNSMVKDISGHISKLESLYSLHLSGCPIVKFPTVDVPSQSLRFKSLKYMHMDRCKSLKLLSELPPYLPDLAVHDCTSLEKVSFADQNLYQFDSLDGDNDEYVFLMLFFNCFNLNQESTNNIEANAMLKIGSLAKIWASRYDWKYRRDNFQKVICCFPGNKISANKFKCQSMNSSLSLKIAPNGGSGSRFLVFAICLVANLTYCPAFEDLECICEYQLTGAGGGSCGGGHEKLRSKIGFPELRKTEKLMGDHVFILSSFNMVDEDKNYEEASFEFKIRYVVLDEEDYEEENSEVENLLMFKRIEVERCGVHVFYVDAESDTDDIDGTDDTDATEKRHTGNKRSFSHDGEEGDGGLKRLK